MLDLLLRDVDDFVGFGQNVPDVQPLKLIMRSMSAWFRLHIFLNINIRLLSFIKIHRFMIRPPSINCCCECEYELFED